MLFNANDIACCLIAKERLFYDVGLLILVVFLFVNLVHSTAFILDGKLRHSHKVSHGAWKVESLPSLNTSKLSVNDKCTPPCKIEE